MYVLEKIELHCDAGRNSWRSTGQSCAVTQPTAVRTERGSSGVLNREGHSVRVGIDELEGEVVSEALHIYGRGEPGAAGFRLPAVSQLQAISIECGASIELQTCCREARGKVDGRRTAALNSDGRGCRVALGKARGCRNGFHRCSATHRERICVKRGGGTRLTAIERVEDGRVGS